MPPTDASSLVGLLSEMFRESQQHGAGVHRKLSSGLHVKAAIQGQQRMLIVWRSGDRLPSAKECELVGEDAGLYDPKYRQWQCRESRDAFLITEGYRGQLCDHAWGFQVVVDDQKAVGHFQTCLRCGVRAQILTPRRGKKPRYGYGKWELRPHVFERWLVRGPVAEALTEQPHHVQPDSAAPPQVSPGPVPAPQGTQQVVQPRVALRAREGLEKALRGRLVAALTAIAFRSACRSAWFARGVVIEARRAYLKGATLDVLREECAGRWFRSNIRRAVPYVLLVARWRHLTRALPAQVAPA